MNLEVTSMNKIVFIDRDGTLINEPDNGLISNLSEVVFKNGLFKTLQLLTAHGFKFIIVTNQDDLGTDKNPLENYNQINEFIIRNFNEHGIKIETILSCPHASEKNCSCRKPKTGLIDNLKDIHWDPDQSFMVGDRQTDIDFGSNLNIPSFLLSTDLTWVSIGSKIINGLDITVTRKTKETLVKLILSRNNKTSTSISTGMPFFDHMLEQLSKHSGLSMQLSCHGDLEIDEHHSVEDIAIVLGQAVLQLIGNKIGIKRYSYLLPMDESISYVAIDICGRSTLVFNAKFSRDIIGQFPSEMVEHFFKSFTDEAKISLHIKTEGINTHHMIESIFKSFGRCLGDAIRVESEDLPSTKGVL
jgi:imidazoleglycerol-phosphate dehydratase/histidinol-phosphatase